MARSDRTFSIRMAGITIAVRGSVDFRRFNDHAFYRDFLAAPRDPADCSLALTIGPSPEVIPGPDPFVADNWQLSSVDGRRMLRLGPPPRRGRPDTVVIFDRDYRRGEMYQATVFELFRRFIDQFLIINLLSRFSGFLLHASGVIFDGKGIAFIGRSGAGKSTLLDLFKDDVPAGDLLNDDRLAVRRDAAGGWRVYGTPWYGTSRIASPAHAPLAALFFICHAKENYARRLGGAEVCRRLMPTGLVPVWDPQATTRVVDAFQDLAGGIPAYELGFVPDKSAVALVKETLSSVIARSPTASEAKQEGDEAIP